MSFARTRIKGLVFCDSRAAFHGLTLYTPVQGRQVLMVDLLGKHVHRWELPFDAAGTAGLLPNGNLLYGALSADAPLADLEGTAGIVQEMNPDGELVWEYRAPDLHHAPCRMRNGNTLVMKPASLTPGVGGLFAELFAGADLPAGVLNFVTGPGGTVGREMIENATVKAVSFTGSTATARIPGSWSLRNFPTPWRVPPLPIPATKASTLPSICSQISLAVSW